MARKDLAGIKLERPTKYSRGKEDFWPLASIWREYSFGSA